jgi:GH18 family chitinase
LPELTRRLDLRRLTHVVVTFANPTATDMVALPSTDADVAVLVTAAHEAGVKVLVAIGGSSGSAKILPLLAPDKVKAYVEAVLAFADARNFDGVDIDVEASMVSPTDYGALVSGLSAGLKPKQKLLSAAVATWFDAQIPDAALAQMDFINLMAYDACGSWTAACEHSTYDFAVRTVDHFVKVRKVPPAKVVLGIPLYGYCWGTACSGPALFYSEILTRFPGAAATDWIDMPNLKISYNGRATIERKAMLGRANGGVMFWHLAADATGSESLLNLAVSHLAPVR